MARGRRLRRAESAPSVSSEGATPTIAASMAFAMATARAGGTRDGGVAGEGVKVNSEIVSERRRSEGM